MVYSSQFRQLLRQLHVHGTYHNTITLKEISSVLLSCSEGDVLELIAFLCFTPDQDLKLKLFSILSACILTGNRITNIIVTYRPLYDTIQGLLERGYPLKSKIVLNFVLAILTCEDEAPGINSLAIFARNILRVSGCLTTMCDMFISSMMYQDTWVALCQCLAEICSGFEVNQSYCSHLIPMCVNRCLQGNADVLPVLLSLLHKHQNNVQLFFEHGGEAIFTRQMLQHDMCLQLLCNIVQNSDQAIKLLQGNDLLHNLSDLINLHGPNTRVTQWSTIILFHLDSRFRVSSRVLDNNIRNENLYSIYGRSIFDGNKDFTKKNITNKQDIRDDHTNSRHSLREVFSRCSANFETKNLPQFTFNATPQDNTTKLFQNILRELQSDKLMRRSTPVKETNTWYQNKNRQCTELQQKAVPGSTEMQELNNCTFSYFEKRNLGTENTKNELSFPLHNVDLLTEINGLSDEGNNDQCSVKEDEMLNDIYEDVKSCPTNYSDSFDIKNKSIDINMTNFKPTFKSTPKQERTISRKNKLTNISKISPHQNQVSWNFSKSRINKQQKMNTTKISKNTFNTTKDIKNRSMSARLFSAINDSCTTLVKSVKNLFTSKKDNNHNDRNAKSIQKFNDSCSYSFTNYMRKRDEMEINCNNSESMEYEDSNVLFRDSCRTCNDTIVLQHKFDVDEHLQQTIKQLKVGVNLYGCDFKKISRTMWPRDRYMTASTLRNLYKKIILGGHQNHKLIRKKNVF